MRDLGNMISDWLEENQDPEIQSFVEKNLAIVDKVRRAMEEKGWKSLDLANAMDKNPSEVSKWLTGMHNLTLKSIIKMEQALGVDLIHTDEELNFSNQNKSSGEKEESDSIAAEPKSKYHSKKKES